MGTGPLCAHGFIIIAKLFFFFFFFKLRLTRGKWSNYVHSYISGTHGVNSTPLWAGTKAMIPGQCGQPLRNETERSHIT